MQKTFAVTIAVTLILGFTAIGLAWRSAAPAVVFATISGEKPAIGDWHGKPVLVTFWASDCAACRKEIPALKTLQQRYAPRGLHLVAVAMAYDMPSHVLSLSQILELPYAVALDPLGELADAFGQVRWTPTTFLIGNDGHILQRSVGLFDPDALAEQIEFLLER